MNMNNRTLYNISLQTILLGINTDSYMGFDYIRPNDRENSEKQQKISQKMRENCAKHCQRLLNTLNRPNSALPSTFLTQPILLRVRNPTLRSGRAKCFQLQAPRWCKIRLSSAFCASSVVARMVRNCFFGEGNHQPFFQKSPGSHRQY